MRWTLTTTVALLTAACALFFTTTSAPRAQEKPKIATAKRITNSIGMELALVPAGKFLMGSPPSERNRRHDELEHEVEISKPYYMGIHEVTQRTYHQVMGQKPSDDKKLDPKKADFPMVLVNWEEAVEFCKKLSALPEETKHGRSYRLPTEAEWEYACRGGPGAPQQPYHYGNRITSKQANFNGRFGSADGADEGPNLGGIAKVGSYEPNALGLFDMHANVWEWCLDLYDEEYYKSSPNKDPQGPDKGLMHVLRGGSCYNPGSSSRCAARYRNFSDRYADAGFRVVCISLR